MLKTAKFVLAALTLSAADALEYAQVHEYIEDDHCKENYISKHRPACVTKDGQCHPPGTQDVECRDVETWQWWNEDDQYMQYAPGVLPPPHRRITHKGNAKEKTVWAYASAITQGLAAQIYGLENQVTVDQTLKTPVNQVAMIANIIVKNPAKWFDPGHNDTDGCGQKQTWFLPYGFDGHDTGAATQRFIQNLTRLKQEGITITLTLASWCTYFPVKEWADSDFSAFVTYFTQLRQETFGGHLDGIDFDWEGYCNELCLKEICSCDWDEKVCGTKSPDELVAGVYWYVPGAGGASTKLMCWMMPNKATLQVLGGITYHMKKAGFVATLVPMSTEAWTGEPDTSPKQNMKNEFIKWRNNTYEGVEFDLLKATDGVLLQWYSGFDGALCSLVDDPHACTCDNIEVPDYPNWDNNTAGGNDVAGLLYSYASIQGKGSNLWPSRWPTRCQACGPNVILPNGTIGDLQCYPDGEDYYDPAASTWEHTSAYKNYTTVMGAKQGGGQPAIPYWFAKKETFALGRCPRAVDCPDWRYAGEKPYDRQIKMLKSLSTVIDLNKISIGYETLGTDLIKQFQSWADPFLIWTTTSVQDHAKGIFFNECTTNMTRSNTAGGKRCGKPVMSSQWGLKMNASEIIGMEARVRNEIPGQEMGGIGVFTIDGFLYEDSWKGERLWYKPLCDLNKNYRIPCKGPCCQQSHWEGLATPAHKIEKTLIENPFIL